MGAFPNIIFRIEDDGKGFDVQKRMGLRGMEERARLLRGRLTLQSSPNEGTIITVKFPYEENESHAEQKHIDC